VTPAICMRLDMDTLILQHFGSFLTVGGYMSSDSGCESLVIGLNIRLYSRLMHWSLDGQPLD